MVPVHEGEVLAGKYRVDRVLGAGGMGVVVLATHLALEQRVALKFLLPEALANPMIADRFLREARAAVRLRSEHVAKVLDVGSLESGAPYIVMEFLQGCDLDQHLEARGPLPVPEIAEVVIHACDAIAEAHGLGIVHRDLKPANLFLTQRADGAPLVKVLDFGISKTNALNEANSALTKTSSVMGSPNYMSPEQMRSAKDVDARADVWSLGVILYQLATRRLPYESETLGGLMAKVLQEAPDVAALEQRSDLPAALRDLISRCLERDRDRRVASVSEIAVALAPFAPPRSQAIVERVVALGQGARPSVEARQGGASSPRPTQTTPQPAMRSGTEMGAPLFPQGSGTVPSDAWNASRTAPTKPSAFPVILAAAAILAILGAALAGFLMLRNRGPSDVAPAAMGSLSAPISIPPSSEPRPSPPTPPAESTALPAAAVTTSPTASAVAAPANHHPAAAPLKAVTPPAAVPPPPVAQPAPSPQPTPAKPKSLMDTPD